MQIGLAIPISEPIYISMANKDVDLIGRIKVEPFSLNLGYSRCWSGQPSLYLLLGSSNSNQQV